nr:hypothetical protein [Bradyrhizobium sp. Ash2021]
MSVEDQAQLRALHDLRAQEAVDLGTDVALPIEVVTETSLPERVG